jgi:hypothetical protein
MSWTHFRDVMSVARKSHICGLCGRKINAGSRQVVRTGRGDDGIETFRMHAECEALTCNWDEMDWETFSVGDGDWPELSQGSSE